MREASIAHPDRFRLAPNPDRAREAAEQLFAKARGELRCLLPASAEILHVGATAVPGCLTKGDLDVAVRVKPSEFRSAEARLVAHFPRNMGSISTGDFAAFEDDTRIPHLGIQLTARGCAFDIFHRFAAALRADPELVHRYNALKRRNDGLPMERYRTAKNAFIAQVLRSIPVQTDDQTG